MLAEALDVRLEGSEGGGMLGHPFLDCARDAVALTAALGRYRPVILTLAGGAQSQDEPYLCRYLDACGIACRPAGNNTGTNPMREYLSPMFARCGVAELFWSGMPLTAVHLVAPRAFLLPGPEARVPDEPEVLAAGRAGYVPGDQWEGAMAFWYSFAWPS